MKNNILQQRGECDTGWFEIIMVRASALQEILSSTLPITGEEIPVSK
jgi:hypothetical protein